MHQGRGHFPHRHRLVSFESSSCALCSKRLQPIVITGMRQRILYYERKLTINPPPEESSSSLPASKSSSISNAVFFPFLPPFAGCGMSASSTTPANGSPILASFSALRCESQPYALASLSVDRLTRMHRHPPFFPSLHSSWAAFWYQFRDKVLLRLPMVAKWQARTSALSIRETPRLLSCDNHEAAKDESARRQKMIGS